MKKLLITILFLLNFSFLLFCADKSFRLYGADSPEYEQIRILYLSAGYAFPSSTGPWSGSELLMYLHQIDESQIPASLLPLLHSLEANLMEYSIQDTEDKIRVQITQNIVPELYVHSNTSVENKRDFSVFRTRIPQNFYTCEIEGFTNTFYSDVGLNARNFEITNYSFGSNSVLCNIPGFQNFKFDTQEMYNSFPDKAIGSIGGTNWALMLGKDRISWGNGVTGNLTISDTLPYHNFMQFGVFYPSFKYTYLLDFFPHPMNYTNTSQTQVNKGLKFYQAHRYEVIPTEKLRFYITEAIIYQSDDMHVDLTYVNPLTIYHNYTCRSMANSTASLEFDYTVLPGLNFYGQFLLDEFSFIGEPDASKVEDNSANPNARALLLGTKLQIPTSKGVLYGSLEGVAADPFIYLRNDGSFSGSAGGSGYSIDYVVAIRRNTLHTINDRSVHFDKYFLGYPYGGDVITGNLNFGYKDVVSEKMKGIEANLFYMIHGTMNADARWRQLGKSTFMAFKLPTKEYIPTTDATPEENELAKRQGTQNTLDVGVSAYYYPMDNVKLYTQLDAINIWNADYQNKGNNQFDFQVVAGVSCKF